LLSPIYIDISLLAAKIGKDHKLAMAYSLILATVKVHNAILCTQGVHFDRLENVGYFKKESVLKTI